MKINIKLLSGILFFQIINSSIFCQKIVGKANFISQGDFYNGKVVNGKRDGFGILESIFGDRLIGNWSNDSFLIN